MSARSGFAFGPFRLDPQRKQLFRDGEPLSVTTRIVDLLTMLVARPGHVFSKDELIAVTWPDIAVADNSLAQAVAALRRLIGTSWIETQSRRGYRFVGRVDPVLLRESDATIDALLAPHRAWVEGRAALESLEGVQVQPARAAFARVLAEDEDQAAAHVGLANACVFQFELTRADVTPDRPALAEAETHARQACRLDPGYAEAWATLGFVLDRAGRHDDARAALRRAVMLEPDNWRHYLRLSYGGWGEERLSAARRTLSLLPDFPMAHWLAATVYIARQAFGEAERELRTGLDAQVRSTGGTRFGAVGLHWLTGLLHLARDEDDEAMAAFTRELADEGRGLLYSRECGASTCYAMGALHLRRDRPREAIAAFEQALRRLPSHPAASLGLAAAFRRSGDVTAADAVLARLAGLAPPGLTGPASVDRAVVQAAALALAGQPAAAAAVVDAALAHEPFGSAGWLLPVDPLLHVQAHMETWRPVLSRLRAGAA